MPTVKNLSYGFLSFALANDETLTLRPRETAEISDDDFSSDAFQQSLRQRRITVVRGRRTSSGSGEQESQSDAQEGGQSAAAQDAPAAPSGASSQPKPTPSAG
ncbi:MAG TPA: hypothetical protein VF666_18490 [Pyrinomonadaceae bacterium]|jgi:hypothetical protein